MTPHLADGLKRIRDRIDPDHLREAQRPRALEKRRKPGDGRKIRIITSRQRVLTSELLLLVGIV